MLAVQAQGSEVRTVEGLSEKGGLGPLQRAFWEHQGLQCGFCTPGMLMVSHRLLGENPTPTAAEVREAIGGNICRCTGYQDIVTAVLATASGTPCDRSVTGESSGRLVGAPVRRVEDPILLLGRGTYVDDVKLPDVLEVAFVRSPLSHVVEHFPECVHVCRTSDRLALPGFHLGRDVVTRPHRFVGERHAVIAVHVADAEVSEHRATIFTEENVGRLVCPAGIPSRVRTTAPTTYTCRGCLVTRSGSTFMRSSTRWSSRSPRRG